MTMGFSDDWFKSYLINNNQYVSRNGFSSVLTAISCSVSQGSVIPLLFLSYISDFNQEIRFFKVHYFAADPNLLCLSNSIKKLNK